MGKKRGKVGYCLTDLLDTKLYHAIVAAVQQHPRSQGFDRVYNPVWIAVRLDAVHHSMLMHNTTVKTVPPHNARNYRDLALQAVLR